MPGRVAGFRETTFDAQEIVGQGLHDGIGSEFGYRRRSRIEEEDAACVVVVRKIHQCAPVFGSELPGVFAMEVSKIVEYLECLAQAAAWDTEGCGAHIFDETVKIKLRKAGEPGAEIDSILRLGVQVSVGGIERIAEPRIAEAHFVHFGG